MTLRTGIAACFFVAFGWYAGVLLIALLRHIGDDLILSAGMELLTIEIDYAPGGKSQFLESKHDLPIT
jgi:hypothetical protein